MLAFRLISKPTALNSKTLLTTLRTLQKVFALTLHPVVLAHARYELAANAMQFFPERLALYKAASAARRSELISEACAG